MIADFIKDESGLWWMIGVRAYKFSNPSTKPYLRLFVEDYEEKEEDKKDDKKEKHNTQKHKIKICKM